MEHLDDSYQPNLVDQTVTSTVRKCARCGGDHPDLVFERMRNPFDDDFPFWAACPNGSGPILLSSYIRPGEDAHPVAPLDDGEGY